MKLWMRKFAVILITILTLGLYIPPIGLTSDADGRKDAENAQDKSFLSTNEVREDHQVEIEEIKDHARENSVDQVDRYLVQLNEKAKEQTITKLGPKIMAQVEDDLLESILPHMESVIEEVVRESADEAVPFYEITEDPSGGLGERIFNVYDHKKDSIILKFHVRRDNRPLEGYWFNFHYHVHADNFERHYHIGDIYWDKNVPPRWMS